MIAFPPATMESILRKKGTSIKRCGSITQLFNIQKPTLSIFQEPPTRRYDIVDTSAYRRSSSPLIERQYISPELESDIRYACSLLVYRIERGVPSLLTDESKPPIRIGGEKERPGAVAEKPVPQIDSKYFAPAVGADVAALKDKHDSGVGLTQQPSRQTMRLLQSSHSDERSDSDEHARGSLFSQIRSTTSSSNTSYAKGISSHSSVKSPRHDGKHSMMGNAMGDTQTNEHDTMSFLAEAPKSGPGGEDASDNIEVFLNSEAAFQSSGIPSFASASGMLSCTSPSFGVRSYLPTHHESHALEQSMFLGDRPASMPSVERSHFDKEGHEPGIIIDTNGIAHTLSIAEEAQRDISLQQAVMAKMKTGSVGSISNAVPAQSPTHTSPHENPYSEHQSIPSRLQSTWLSRSKAATLKWKSRSEPSPHPSPRFPKLVGLFRKRRTPDQENPLEKPSTITQ